MAKAAYGTQLTLRLSVGSKPGLDTLVVPVNDDY